MATSTAAVDEYSIVYGTGERSRCPGNVVEQQLTGLEESTTYSVTITSLLGDTHSSPATASFTTTPGEEEEEGGPQHFQARQVTPRTALLSWETPAATAVDRYRLTYQTEGEEPKEVTLNATTTNHKLRRLRPGSVTRPRCGEERDGRPGPPVPAHFNTGPLRFPHPADCSEELLNGRGSQGRWRSSWGGAPGVPLPVYCDMETDGGGWTVFQRRSDGSIDFFRGWKDYVKGFGELGGEFWMGLDNLHLLTSGADMSLRVDLRDGEEAAYARYSTFRVAKRNYRLSVAGYSGTAGDSMSYHSGRPFSTRDRDPDRSITRCAVSYRGGWWYWNCHKANLNGLYGSGERHQGVIWTTWKGKDFSVPFTEMKMRPSAFIPPAR
ncbi:microfibril-associated glycoprotein 4-like [Gadus macrocephalus]|uniref:microfibril-associated glycoprotein 4-like n=1 Tax=Gadus macrocephalus TaxID=80720 RepID=UPI0028CBB724|nr:microfibril-associated glycoprotein 4-like [Gadus macrocephalus]